MKKETQPRKRKEQPRKLSVEEGMKQWAEGPRHYRQWVRDTAQRYGLDATRVNLGQLLDMMNGDDHNCFMIGQDYMPYMKPGRELILERLQGEIDAPELPADLKEPLTQAYQAIAHTDWSTDEGRQQAYQVWKPSVYDAVGELIQQRPDYKEARSYSRQAFNQIASDYNAFLKRQQ